MVGETRYKGWIISYLIATIWDKFPDSGSLSSVEYILDFDT